MIVRNTLIALAAAAVLLALYVRLPQAGARGDGPANPSRADCNNAAFISRLTEIPEASGLASSRQDADVFWSHNDSSDAVLYAIGSDGLLKGRVQMRDAVVTDWEAVTTAACPLGWCVYIGDIGDNQASRDRVTIYRAAEPAVADSTSAPVEAFEAVYPDGAQDAEALFATPDGTLYLVTKGEGAPVHLYRVPTLIGTVRVTLTRVATLTGHRPARSARVTDAAVSPDGDWVVLRTSDKLLFYRTADLTAGRDSRPREFDLRGLKEPQGEGIAWAGDNTLYLAGESQDGGTLARVSCTLPSPGR